MIISVFLGVNVILCDVTNDEFEYAEDIYLRTNKQFDGCNLDKCSEVLSSIINKEINNTLIPKKENKFYKLNGLMAPN